MRDYEIIIIGAGVSGSAIARELSRYDVKCLVVDKEEDVCCGTSKANSAIIHAGYDAANGSMMAKMNVEGNAMMTKLAADLDIPFKRNGSLVVCTKDQDPAGLEELLEKAKANGDNVYFIEGMEMFKDFREFATVDHSHPNDYGFVTMAQAVMEVLKEIDLS